MDEIGASHIEEDSLHSYKEDKRWEDDFHNKRRKIYLYETQSRCEQRTLPKLFDMH